MVKKLYLITILFLFTSFYSFADDCYEAFTEAKFYYNNSDYKTAKELFEYVKRECGEDYGYATDWIKKCDDALIARLSVSKSLINVGYSSGTEIITVTSNRNWVLRHTDSNMFSVSRNGNNITIQYYSNFSTNSRRDYFDVETSDGSKSVRIYVEQQGKAPTSAKIHKVWVEHNVMYNNIKCMKIHVHFEVDNMNGKTGMVAAYFNKESGEKLLDTNSSYRSKGGQVCVSGNFNSIYDNCEWKDFFLYIPNSELHITQSGNYKFCINIFDHNNRCIAISDDWITFTYRM